MKINLLLILTIISLSAKAQTSVYHQFPDSNAIWREDRDQNDGSFMFRWNVEKFINGDTVISGISYHKIYESGYYAQYGLPAQNLIDSYYYYNTYFGVIRQGANKKVYTYNTFSNQDELLYDFNLQVGDTIPFAVNHPTGFGDTLTISRIDSIFDGTNYRKHFFITAHQSGFTDSNYTSIIEGIGSTYGLFYIIDPPFEYTGTLKCFIQNDSTKYTDGSLNACDLITNVNEHSQQGFSINIFPNPFNYSTTIKVSDEFFNAELNIFNAIGEVVNHQTIKGKTLIIYRNDFDEGIYFYQITSNKGKVRTGKFMIQ